MKQVISLVPDRLAHYRAPVFDNLACDDSYSLAVYADLRSDGSGIRKPTEYELGHRNFTFKHSLDYRYKGRLLLSTGSIKAALDHSEILVLWGDAFAPGNWVAVALARIQRKKVVFWTHGVYGNESFLKRKIRVFFYSLADALLLYGQHAKKLLIKEGFSPNKLFVINNALDFKLQNELFEQYQKKMIAEMVSNNDNSLTLIFVGRLTKEKKLGMLLDAVRLLRDELDIQVNIVGDGAERSALEEQSKNLGLDGNVVFHGEIYEEEKLSELICAADVMVSPGNVGLTAMHALVYGIPVISHSNAAAQMPEFEAITPGLTGELFKENDVFSLCESLTRCKYNLVLGHISASSCRSVMLEKYSFTYQSRVFCECLRKGLGVDGI